MYPPSHNNIDKQAGSGTATSVPLVVHNARTLLAPGVPDVREDTTDQATVTRYYYFPDILRIPVSRVRKKTQPKRINLDSSFQLGLRSNVKKILSASSLRVHGDHLNSLLFLPLANIRLFFFILALIKAGKKGLSPLCSSNPPHFSSPLHLIQAHIATYSKQSLHVEDAHPKHQSRNQ